MLSWATNLFPLASISLVSLRPAIIIPIFFGITFGPVVGMIDTAAAVIWGALGIFVGIGFAAFGGIIQSRIRQRIVALGATIVLDEWPG